MIPATVTMQVTLPRESDEMSSLSPTTSLLLKNDRVVGDRDDIVSISSKKLSTFDEKEFVLYFMAQRRNRKIAVARLVIKT